MTTRRAARARPTVDQQLDTHTPPAALRVGRLVDVWADPADPWPIGSAWRRFSLARDWWVTQAGLDPAQSWRIVPAGAPWSLHQLEPGAAAQRLARAGCTPADLDRLLVQAAELTHRSGTPQEDLDGRVSR